jgi:anti-anti-sigma regulatory factor
MTLKIEMLIGGTITLRLVGRIEAVHLPELEDQIRRHGRRLVLDLDEVTLVDAAVVRFLVECEAAAIELRNAAPYIRAWMDRERGRAS